MRLTCLAILLVLGFEVGTATAQVTGSIQYCVNVSTEMSLLPPTGPVSVVHSGLSADQPIGVTDWTCVSNDADGATATFTTTGGFVHETVLTELRDARLSLVLDSADSGSGWAVTTPTDQTDVGAVVPDLVATVQAESSAPGNATLSLDVTFVTGNAATLLPGVYCATIVGTVTAK